ncbi:MAG: hypothetical protein BGO59_08730 [Spirosoma sp. 48-14]|nr:MAG: hypothetical protein BGO59_08730 [Spirosoma sp. 48-14]
MVQISSLISGYSSKRLGLRYLLVKSLGPRLTEWTNEKVFFRRNITETHCIDAFNEIIKNNETIICLRIELPVSIPLDDTQYYKIIRYCLYSLDAMESPSVVFTNPTSNNTLELIIQSSSLYPNNELYKKHQSILYEFMALQIAIWLLKPTYYGINLNTALGTKTSNLSNLSSIEQERYIGRAIYDALVRYKVKSITMFFELLKKKFQIEIDIKNKTSKYLYYRYRIINSQTWHNSHEFLLPTSCIYQWISFNAVFNNLWIVDRIINGVK